MDKLCTQKMKKEITLGQLLGASVTILIALVTGWITITNKVTRQETKMHQLEANYYSLQLKMDAKFDRIEGKIDNVNQDTRTILIQLQNKADRK